MIPAMMACVVLVITTILILYETLRLTSNHSGRAARAAARPHRRGGARRLRRPHPRGLGLRPRLLGVSRSAGRWAAFAGLPVEGFQDCLYFSVVTYTTLGFGDHVPVSHARLIAGVEGLERPHAHRLVGVVHLPRHGALLAHARGSAQASRTRRGAPTPSRVAFAGWRVSRRRSLEPLRPAAIGLRWINAGARPRVVIRIGKERRPWRHPATNRSSRGLSTGAVFAVARRRSADRRQGVRRHAGSPRPRPRPVLAGGRREGAQPRADAEKPRSRPRRRSQDPTSSRRPSWSACGAPWRPPATARRRSSWPRSSAASGALPRACRYLSRSIAGRSPATASWTSARRASAARSGRWSRAGIWNARSPSRASATSAPPRASSEGRSASASAASSGRCSRRRTGGPAAALRSARTGVGRSRHPHGGFPGAAWV